MEGGWRRLLSRFKKAHIAVYEAGVEDVAACSLMLWCTCREGGKEVPVADMNLLTDYIVNLIGGEQSSVLIATDGKARLGMICCSLAIPDPWDTAPVGIVWMLYVAEDERKNPAVAVSLMRGAVLMSQAWGAKKIRVAIDHQDSKARRRYEKSLGFVPEATYVTYTTGVEA
jgi:hypothetical protein